MHLARHQPPSELQYLPANTGLDEFDDEGGEVQRTARALQGPEELRLFTVVEQYEPWDIDTPLGREQSVGAGQGSPLRLLRRLAMTVALVAIPSGTPVETEGLPSPVIVAVAPAAPSEPLPPPPVEAPTLPPVPVPAPATTPEPPAPPSLESLREAFAGLNGPFMSFDHCQVRLASANRVVARCQGVQNEAAAEGSPPQPHRVEWTLEFNQAEQRWQMVDAAAR